MKNYLSNVQQDINAEVDFMYSIPLLEKMFLKMIPLQSTSTIFKNCKLIISSTFKS